MSATGSIVAYFDPSHDFANPLDARPAIVFTGVMNYRPNVEAMVWFVEQVMPRLRARAAAPCLWIVGSNPSPAVLALAGPDVRVTGRVPDVRPYLKHAQVAVAPLQIGRGIQNKVLEAMAMGVPVVATPQAREGLDSCADDEILTATTPADFAAAIGRVLDRAMPGRIGARARARVVSRLWLGGVSGGTRPASRSYWGGTGSLAASSTFAPSPFPREQPMTVHTPKIGLPIARRPPCGSGSRRCFGSPLSAPFSASCSSTRSRGAVRVWNDSTAYNHCYLVLPLAGALLWMRRDVLATCGRRRHGGRCCCCRWHPRCGLPPPCSMLLEAAQLSVVLLFEILLLAVLGWRVFRALMAPLLFLFFLVPFGEFLVPTLQTFTAAFTVHGLELLGIPVFADGYIIQIPAGTFEVAEACAGLRFLIASIVFGCFFATIVYRSIWRRSIFIALSIIVPIVANGFRALGLVLLGHFMGNAASAMADHVLYGWLFFTIVTLVLIAIGISFRETMTARTRRGRTPASAPAAQCTARAGDGRRLAARPRRTGLFLLDGACLGGAGPAADGFAVPPRDSAWMRERDTDGDWVPKADRAEHTAVASYRNGQATVTEIVAFYPVPTRGNPLTRTATTSFSRNRGIFSKPGALPPRWTAVPSSSTRRKSPRRPAAARMVVLYHRWPADRQRSGSKAAAGGGRLARRAPSRRACALSTEIRQTLSDPGAATLAAFAEKLAPL